MNEDTKDQINRLLIELGKIKIDPLKDPDNNIRLSRVVAILEVWQDDLVIANGQRKQAGLSESEIDWLEKNHHTVLALYAQREMQNGRK